MNQYVYDYLSNFLANGKLITLSLVSYQQNEDCLKYSFGDNNYTVVWVIKLPTAKSEYLISES